MDSSFLADCWLLVVKYYLLISLLICQVLLAPFVFLIATYYPLPTKNTTYSLSPIPYPLIPSPYPLLPHLLMGLPRLL
jgi:hypothetical protein